jgi:hypothetical protein
MRRTVVKPEYYRDLRAGNVLASAGREVLVHRH